MRRLASLLTSALAGLTMLASAPSAMAQSSPSSPQTLPGKRMANAALGKLRGGTDTASGAVAGNQAVNVTTGSNTITAGSLAGTSGVPVVIQNSGNNVLIQSSVTVNVQLK